MMQSCRCDNAGEELVLEVLDISHAQNQEGMTLPQILADFVLFLIGIACCTCWRYLRLACALSMHSCCKLVHDYSAVMHVQLACLSCQNPAFAMHEIKLALQLLLTLVKVLKVMLCLAATIAASFLCQPVLGEPIRDPDFNKTCVTGGQSYGRR